MVEFLRESFSPYLAMGVMFSVASVWAAVKGLRTQESVAPRHPAAKR
jgi:hypothetical protein